MIALAKAKGTPGEKGLNGIDGMRGADGLDGINGLRGADGLRGAKGLDGLKGEIGAVGPQGDKGEAGMIWRGTFRSDIEYEIGDVVGVNGSAYVCIAATNQAPPVGFGWELLVSRGAQGVRGIKGETGAGSAIDLPVSIANGGTGQTTQKGAIDALLPDQAGNTNYLLKTNGVSVSWTPLAAPALTLTGSTLASNVLASSLTSTGTLAALTVTATIAGSIDGNAATATTAGTVTNPNLTGEVTTSGLTATVANSAVIAKVLTGYIQSSGAIVSTDTILQAIQKLDGNVSIINGGFPSGEFEDNTFDADALVYITAVETADAQTLETGVKDAINTFVVGCKADGIWNAMKATCILAGARTLTGALVPLKGTAPTNFNFVSGDYNRKTGLVGDGSTKYLDSNRAENVDPLNSIHTVVYLTTATPAGKFSIYGGDNANATGFYGDYIYSRTSTTISSGSTSLNGFAGMSRSGASTVAFIKNGATGTATTASVGRNTTTFNLFRSPTYTAGTYHSSGRMAFYSIGEAIDLALFNTRVTTLINEYSAAIA